MAKGAGESAEKVVRDIRRKTRRRFSAEEKIRIVLEETGSRRASPLCAAAKGS
jgi:transposase-like protein